MISINCTVVELKQLICKQRVITIIRINCTVVELKHIIISRTFNPNSY